MSSIPITTIRPAVHRPTVARPAGKNVGQQNGVAAGVGSTPAHIHSVEQINHRQFDDGGQHDEPRPLLRAKLRAVSHGPTSLHPLTRRGRVSGQGHKVEGGADAESTASGSNVTSISPAFSSQGGESGSDLGSAGQFAYSHRSEGNEEETITSDNRAGQDGPSASGREEVQEANGPQSNVAHIEASARHRQRANDNAQQVYRAGLAAGFSTAAVMQAMLHHYGVEQFSSGLQALRKIILDDMGSGVHSRNKVLMSAQLFGVRTCVRLGGSLKRCHDLLERFQPSGSNNHILSVNLLQQVVNCTMQGVNANQVGAISKLLVGDHVQRQVVALNALYFMFKQQLPLVMWKNENSRYQALQSLEQIMIQHAGIDRANRLSLSMTATGVPR